MSPLVRRLLGDTLLWAALAVPALAADRIGLNEPRAAWQELTGLAVLAAAVAVRRAHPLLAFLAVALLGLAASPSLFTVSYAPALAVFAALLGARTRTTAGAAARPEVSAEAEKGAGEDRQALALFGGLALAGTVRILVRDVDPVPEWLVLLGTLLFTGCFPWLAGRYRRQRAELVTSALARAAQLEREQRIIADRARLRERARIAQDMHDSLGHELSLLALRAGALQLDPALDARHRAAAAELRGAAAAATDRLREIIGLLRDEGEERAPLVPAGESVADLVARARASGLDVRLRTEGTDAVHGPRERTVHRIVQEALTNAVKYAPGAPVTVRVVRGAEGTTVDVTDAGAPGGPPAHAGAPDGPPAEAGGTGLIGLRERVLDEGGTFDADVHGEGFRVRAWLPADHRPRAQPRAAEADPPPRAEEAEPRPSSATDPGRPQSATDPGPPPWSAEPGPPPHHPQLLAGLRRRTRLAFALAGAAGVLLVAGTFAWYAYSNTHSVLPPADYARLRTGDPESEAAKVLPRREVADPPADRAPAPPAGADCRYYRASGRLFTSVERFRLCFADGRLLTKDVIPAVGDDPTPTGTPRKDAE